MNGPLKERGVERDGRGVKRGRGGKEKHIHCTEIETGTKRE